MRQKIIHFAFTLVEQQGLTMVERSFKISAKRKKKEEKEQQGFMDAVNIV